MKKIAILLVICLSLMPLSVLADEIYSEDAEIIYGSDEKNEEVNEKVSSKSDSEELFSTASDEEPEVPDDEEDYVYQDTVDDQAGIRVYVKGEKITFDVEPTIINSRTMVPMRAIFEALGAEVKWDAATRSASGLRNGTTIVFKIGESCLYKNNISVELDSPPVIIDSRTLVPVRAIAESFGCTVKWDAATRSVYIEE